MVCAPREDSDQPVHPPSLITHDESLGLQRPIERTAKTLIRLGTHAVGSVVWWLKLNVLAEIMAYLSFGVDVYI